MQGWIIPPPKDPTKSKEEFNKERVAKARWLVRRGYLKSDRIKEALLKIPREEFIPHKFKDYAYLEVPIPLPGEQATISCPHSYPLFYEPLGLDKDHRFLEVGLGSGYGTAIAREIVGQNGLVVSIEIDPLTFEFAKRNLDNAGYNDVTLVKGDGGFGYPEMSPYDSIAVTAACIDIPSPLIEQLNTGGKLIAPVLEDGAQKLVLLEKYAKSIQRHVICDVLYISLRGVYGS
jgi:protein-L-isoaspartate(D-aspartate) O-methyltransferase